MKVFKKFSFLCIILILFVFNFYSDELTRADWQTGVYYNVGDIVSYSGSNWKCLTAHTSNESWCPGCPGVYLWEQTGDNPTPTATSVITPTTVSTNIAQGKPAYGSSTYSSQYPASQAVDGLTSTGWGSGTMTNAQWIYVDLQSIELFTKVEVYWYS